MRKSIALGVATLLLPGLIFAQANISGSVTDAGTGENLVGANVIVEGTEVGTSTDAAVSYTHLTLPTILLV